MNYTLTIHNWAERRGGSLKRKKNVTFVNVGSRIVDVLVWKVNVKVDSDQAYVYHERLFESWLIRSKNWDNVDFCSHAGSLESVQKMRQRLFKKLSVI